MARDTWDANEGGRVAAAAAAAIILQVAAASALSDLKRKSILLWFGLSAARVFGHE